MKILVIEDNVELLQDIKNFLEREGNVCEIAPDYKTAYMKVGIFPYDILVVDITLPDGNGLDIIKETKKENKLLNGWDNIKYKMKIRLKTFKIII